MNILNIEFKAKVNDHDAIRAYLKSNKADYIGKDIQTDYYYLLGEERLKLREGNIENSLIYYQRPETPDLKTSAVILQKIPENSQGLQGILTKLHGLKTVVRKEREIYFIDNVKFHLDRVRPLGLFLEIEAISEEGKYSKDQLYEQCQFHMEALQISKEQLIARSYSDMLMDSDGIPGK